MVQLWGHVRRKHYRRGMLRKHAGEVCVASSTWRSAGNDKWWLSTRTEVLPEVQTSLRHASRIIGQGGIVKENGPTCDADRDGNRSHSVSTTNTDVQFTQPPSHINLDLNPTMLTLTLHAPREASFITNCLTFSHYR